MKRACILYCRFVVRLHALLLHKRWLDLVSWRDVCGFGLCSVSSAIEYALRVFPWCLGACV